MDDSFVQIATIATFGFLIAGLGFMLTMLDSSRTGPGSGAGRRMAIGTLLMLAGILLIAYLDLGR